MRVLLRPSLTARLYASRLKDRLAQWSMVVFAETGANAPCLASRRVELVSSMAAVRTALIMAALWNTIIFLPCGFFVLSSSSFFLA